MRRLLRIVFAWALQVHLTFRTVGTCVCSRHFASFVFKQALVRWFEEIRVDRANAGLQIEWAGWMFAISFLIIRKDLHIPSGGFAKGRWLLILVVAGAYATASPGLLLKPKMRQCQADFIL